MHHKLTRYVAMAGLVSLAAACSNDRAPDTSSLAAHETGTRSIDQEAFASLVELADFNAAGFWVRDGSGGLMPSEAISGAMYPDEQPPQPANHIQSFDIPQIDYDPGFWSPTLHATMTRLDKHAVGVWMGADSIHAQVILDGAVHVATAWPWPDGDVILDQVTINVAIALRGGQLSTTEVGANVQDHVENCGAFGWCSALVSGLLPDLSSQVASAIQAKLDELLPSPEVGRATVSFLEALTNIVPPADGVRWQVAPDSINLAGWQVSYAISRDTSH